MTPTERMAYLDALMRLLEGDKVVSAIVLTNDDAIRLLDSRDSDEASEEWNAHSEFITSPKFASILLSHKEAIDKIREFTFLQTFGRWHSHDIAACVSDDFEIIAAALVTNVDDPWITTLASHERRRAEFRPGSVLRESC